LSIAAALSGSDNNRILDIADGIVHMEDGKLAYFLNFRRIDITHNSLILHIGCQNLIQNCQTAISTRPGTVD